MKGKIRKSSLIFVIFFVTSLIFVNSSLKIENGHFHGYKTIFTDQTIQDTASKDNLDVLIFFKNSIPVLEKYESVIIKKYNHFPIVRFQFTDESRFISFLQEYKKKIVSIESIIHSKSSFVTDGGETEEKVDSVQSIIESTGAEKVHQLGYTGSRVKIGIIDTGISAHEEFGTRIKGSAVFVSQINGYSQDITSTSDEWSHGTHVAGLAAGNSSGLAPSAEIFSAKVIHSTSVTGAGGGGGEETTLGILEAIEYLINNTVDVINISLGQYHNLGTGMRQELINYATFAYNIVFCVSVGNSGSEYGDRGSLNNPSTALQCIAVTASDTSGRTLADFSSKGPKPDYSVKPDITAPGINVLGPSHLGGGYMTKSGTSMASPIAAGAAALLIDYLKGMNLSYTPGTIKSALLSGSTDMGFQPWRQGAGFVNVSRAIEVIQSSPLVNNTPDILYLHPQELPIDPYEILFTENNIEFNLTVISSRVKKIDFDIPESLSEILNFPDSGFILNNSKLIPVQFNIPANYSPQYINSSVMVGDQELRIKFEIRNPVARILFDESYNRIVKHGFGTAVYEIQGDASNTIGMYSNFVRYLSYENNYSVTPNIRGELTEENLNDYNVVILANPFSLASDIYMDWVSNPGTSFLAIPPDSIQTLYDFVDNGGGLLVISTDDSYCDIPALNNFMAYFDLQIQNLGSEWVVQTSVINSYNWTQHLTTIPFRGNYLQTTGSQTTIFATHDGNPTIASYTSFSGGRVLLFGSDLTFDNIGFSTYAYHGNSEQNRIISFNAVAWLAKGEYRNYSPNDSLEFPEFTLILVIIFGLVILVLSFQIIRRK